MKHPHIIFVEAFQLSEKLNSHLRGIADSKELKPIDIVIGANLAQDLVHKIRQLKNTAKKERKIQSCE